MPENLHLTTWEQWLRAVTNLPARQEPEHRRREERGLPEFGVANVTFTHHSRRRECSGKIMNASTGGLMLRTHDAISDGVDVELQVAFEDEMFYLTGTVAHCTMSIGGYKIGIELKFPSSTTDAQSADIEQSGSGFHEDPEPTEQ